MNAERPPLSSNGVDKFSINKYTTKCNCLHVMLEVIQQKLFKRRLGPLVHY